MAVSIPTFASSYDNGSHVRYTVRVVTLDARWAVVRRFRQFRELHLFMCHTYGAAASTLSFPSRKLFGSASDSCARDRQRQLQHYLTELFKRCSAMPNCPLFRRPYRESVIDFARFFEPLPDESVPDE